MAGRDFGSIFSPIPRFGNLSDLAFQINRAGSATAGGWFLEITALYPKPRPAIPKSRPGSVEKFFWEIKHKTMLPACIVHLIQSFLGKRKKERRPCMHAFAFDYMSIADWEDTDDVRAYGDY